VRLLIKQAVGPVEGRLIIPNSKYHAHRALILGSLAPGTSRIRGLSDAGHVRHTISMLRHLGVRIDVDGDDFVVHGGTYKPNQEEISVGSSGTTLYFMTGLMALAEKPVTVIGQKYFQRRPIGPLLNALRGLGVQLESPDDCPPISVTPKRPTGGEVHIAGTLSQWISALLLIAPFAEGKSTVIIDGDLNERTYIDLTIRMMADFGLHVTEVEKDRRFEIEGNQQPHPADVTLPPDIGAAAFGLAVSALHPADVLFGGLPYTDDVDSIDHPEADLVGIVRDMGLPMTRDEATGLVRVKHDGIRLKPTDVDCRRVPDMLPVLSVLSTFADGTTTLRNVAHVRLKESDRVSAMLQLNRMGANLEQRDDYLKIHGIDGDLTGVDLSSFNDHRVLMALAVAGTRAEGETRLTYPNAYRISYPRFLDEMNGVGLFMHTAPGGKRTTSTPARAEGPPAIMPAKAAQTPIADYVRRWALEKPTEPAVIEVGTDRHMNWRELNAETDRIAGKLVELGVQPGEPVAYQLPNRAEFVALAMAIARIGAVSTPLMPIFRQREVAFMLQKSKARVMVVPTSFRGRDYPAELQALLADTSTSLEHVLVIGGSSLPSGGGVKWHDFAEQAKAGTKVTQKADVEAPAQLLFTSGTSGEPKGVLHRMEALTRAAAMEIRHLGLTESDRVFIPSPLAHQTGFLYGMWVAIVRGVPSIVQPVWDGRTALSALRQHGGTFVQAATPFLNDLVEAVDETGERPEALRIFVATGTVVPRGLAERATRTLGASVCGAWGSTESCLGSLSAPGDDPAKMWGTDGRALAGIKLRITDDDGNVLAPGQEGNYEVHNPTMFIGYLDHPEWTAEALTPDGYFRTGDLAVIDDAGYVHINGRVKDVVNRGGEKVPVAEIEQLMHTHPAVRDVAIVAMPDPRLGERACAFVVLNGDLDLVGLQAFLDERKVAKQYWPERLEVVNDLPRNTVGKIQKFVLRQQIVQTMESEDRG
jgi:cyclohexanecarboxylate-CoA ligase